MTEHRYVTVDQLTVAELRDVCRQQTLPESYDRHQMRKAIIDRYRNRRT